MVGYFNELSLPVCSDYREVNKIFSNFAELYKQLSGYNLNTVKVHSNFLDHSFAPECSFYAWSQHGDTDKDISILLISVLTTSPYAEEIFQEYEGKQDAPVEFYYKKQRCLGLGLASEVVNDTFAISLAGNSFDEPEYEVCLKYLDDVDGTVVEVAERTRTRNISSIEHLTYHEPTLKARIRNSVETGANFWRDRETYFPNLIFCEQVEKQIENMNQSHAEFIQILKRIFELNAFVGTWDLSNIKPSDFPSKVSPESEARLKALKKQLTTLCPDGEHRLFSWHSRYTPGSGRIYFFPIEGTKKFIIGSIALKIT